MRGSAAWQLDCCYATGFGVSKDWGKADEYFEQAKELGSRVAQVFGPILYDQGSLHEGTAYRNIIRQEFSLNDVPSRLVFDLRQDTVSIQTVVRSLVSRTTSDAEENIHQGYLSSISDISKDHSWRELQSEEPPLIQALRAGNWRAVKALLAWGCPPHTSDNSGRNMFHWLFMIDDDATAFVEQLLNEETLIQPDALNQSASHTRNVHPQWPLRLYGTPLMHAIATGSKNTVAALLKLGADPLAISRTENGNHNARNWTSLHTAVEYHDAEALELLVEALRQRTWDMDVDMSMALCSATNFERIAMHGRNSKKSLDRIMQISASPPMKDLEEKATASQLTSKLQSDPSTLVMSLEIGDLVVSKALLYYNTNLVRTQYIFDCGDTTISSYPIHHAIQMASRRDDPNALAAVNLVLKHDRVSLFRLDGSGRTCLHIAASGLSTHVINFIVERQRSLLYKRDHQGAYPVHYCETNTILEQLVSLGTPIDVTDKEGRSIYTMLPGKAWVRSLMASAKCKLYSMHLLDRFGTLYMQRYYFQGQR